MFMLIHVITLMLIQLISIGKRVIDSLSFHGTQFTLGLQSQICILKIDLQELRKGINVKMFALFSHCCIHVAQLVPTT